VVFPQPEGPRIAAKCFLCENARSLRRAASARRARYRPGGRGPEVPALPHDCWVDVALSGAKGAAVSTPRRRHSAAGVSARETRAALGRRRTGVLLVIGFFAARAWVESYLKSERFRLFAAARSAIRSRRRRSSPLSSHGGCSFYSDGLIARGSEHELLRACASTRCGRVSTRRFLERVWQIEESGGAAAGGDDSMGRARLLSTAAATGAHRTHGHSVAAKRVEIGSARSPRGESPLGPQASAGGSPARPWRVEAHDGRLEHRGVSGRLEQAGLSCARSAKCAAALPRGVALHQGSLTCVRRSGTAAGHGRAAHG
jgi:hypothetical protein